MKVVSSSNALLIIRNSLNRIDPRLVGHGERVAYIMYRILQQEGRCQGRELVNVMFLGIVHDIGAYKTEEIDQMVRFESSQVWEHSVYGYLFMRYCTPLAAYAEEILYHHLPHHLYAKVGMTGQEDRYASLIYLADRIDMLCLQRGRDFCLRMLRNNRSHNYNPYWTGLLLAAEEAQSFLDRLEEDSTQQQVLDLLDQASFSDEEKRQFLLMLTYTIDFRSEFTVSHTITTLTLSQFMAELFELSPREKNEIYYGALLHDIGKITTPLEILEKPGRLTAEEMAVMRQHVEVTREILDCLDSSAVIEIASRHHERMDGSGYPQGLKGEQLSLAERIVAVCDVVSALVRQRSYKDAFPKEQVVEILTRQRDAGQLCPLVTDTLLEHYDEALAVSRRNSQQTMALYQQMRQEYSPLLERLSHMV